MVFPPSPAVDVRIDCRGVGVVSLGNAPRIVPCVLAAIPALNYTAGATVIGAFSTEAPANSYEVFVAVGRPGEPIAAAASNDRDGAQDGVAVQRHTTSDFVTWSGPTTVLFLPNGPSPGKLGDGNIWTVKSMDRNSTG